METISIEKRFRASVREFRKQLGMTQGELSQRAGLHRSYISELERGERNISLKSVGKLADALGISVSALFYRSPAAKPIPKDSRSSEPIAARSGQWHAPRQMDNRQTG
jgi:transcriptional regulator with XRE-family HTH domain